jgi:hypothetical protein
MRKVLSRLMSFNSRGTKTFDPEAKIIKMAEVLGDLGNLF